MMESQRSLLHYLVGVALVSMGDGGIRWQALRPDVEEAVLVQALERLDAMSPSSFEGALAFELCEGPLPVLGTTAEGPDSDAVASSLAKLIPPDRPRTRAVVSRGMASILAGHPRPFDRMATVRELGRFFGELDALARAPWAEPVLSSRTEYEAVAHLWPKSLRLDAYQGTRRAAEDGGEGEAPYDVPPESLKDDDVSRIRAALSGIENPVGKLLIAWVLEEVSGAALVRQPFELSAEREATRLVVALRLRILRGHELPRSLDALVEEGILQSVPVDPFSGKAMGYSHKKRLIWSTGVYPDADVVESPFDGQRRVLYDIWPLDAR
jgi:hypothetical protein